MSANNSNQEPIRTREEYKQAKAEEQQRKKDAADRAKNEKRKRKSDAKEDKVINEEKKEAGAAPTNNKRIRIRLMPIWLRLILIVVLIFVCMASGAVVGYGMLGGGKIADVFKESTWTHIRDLVDKGK
ncbi:DNA-directed RNA polymerase subunit beta [Neobacillus soli]|uniref:DNA-directed RNA polymerase subunit beta n=1 Tax=Neobacillus soli TaxID=220688 RepID=UPI000826A0FC|nr:DNA-directed RNA polymerase subunit beta [Neobacillus soli]